MNQVSPLRMTLAIGGLFLVPPLLMFGLPALFGEDGLCHTATCRILSANLVPGLLVYFIVRLRQSQVRPRLVWDESRSQSPHETMQQPALRIEFQQQLCAMLCPTVYRRVLQDSVEGLVLHELVENSSGQSYLFVLRYFTVGDGSPYFMRDVRRELLRCLVPSPFLLTRNVHLVICGTMRELAEYASQLRPDRTNQWVMFRSVQLVDVDTRESRLIEGWGAWGLGNARRVPTFVEELLRSLPPPASGLLPNKPMEPDAEKRRGSSA